VRRALSCCFAFYPSGEQQQLDPAASSSDASAIVRQLLTAWHHTGELAETGVTQLTQMMKDWEGKFHARVEQRAHAVTSARLRNCSLVACGAREVHPSQFKLCAACKTVVYCSKEHQAADSLALAQSRVQGGAGRCSSVCWRRLMPAAVARAEPRKVTRDSTYAR
jgi:hypothetical protein